MTLRARLALGFLTIALLLAVPLAASLYALRHARLAVEELREQPFAASLLMTRLRGTTDKLRRAEQLVYVERATKGTTELQQQIDTLRALADSLRPYGVADLEKQTRQSTQALTTYARVEIAALMDGEMKVAENVSLGQMLPAIDAVEREVALTDAQLRNRAADKVEAAADATSAAGRIAMALLLAAVAAAAIVAIWITRSISRPVQDLERGMHEVSEGNFTHELSVAPGRDDEFGRLAASFASMTDQLAELDKLKAEFVSVASHELKTPINVIMGYLKLLEENLYGPMSERQTEVVHIMQTQADALARLVQHLLDVSRFQAGAARLEARPMTLQGFLTQLEATYEVLALQRGITFAVTTGEALPEVVTWDIDRMHEVLGNLLSNAFKFTEPGGRVDLVVSSLDGSVYIEIRDTGVGIDAAQLPHIFDKFFQADNQHGTGTKGSGLGLAITKEIVEAHGGSIAAASTVGVGTKFSMMLPVSSTPHTGETPIVTGPTPTTGDATPTESESASASAPA